MNGITTELGFIAITATGYGIATELGFIYMGDAPAPPPAVKSNEEYTVLFN